MRNCLNNSRRATKPIWRRSICAGCALVVGICLATSGFAGVVDIVERPVSDLRHALQTGTLTAETLTQAFLDRIAALDDTGPRLNAIIEINPDAMAIARRLDQAFAAQGLVGPLHGLPVVLKANIDTADRMHTTAGSVALADHRATADAFLVAQLRRAGAVILGKTNMSEWANFRSSRSVSGWSSLGGQTRNPHATDRNPCGSSSGSAVAVAAFLAPLAVGTETDGSIVCPAGINGIVGIKPTVGLVSRSGLIPVAVSQDTAGPMANSVYAAALLLQSMVGIDGEDPASTAPQKNYLPDPAQADLHGVRMGVWRDFTGSSQPQLAQVFADNLAVLERLGAELVDPVELNLSAKVAQAEFQVLLHEFKVGLNQYLTRAGGPLAVRSLTQLIAYNNAHAQRVMPIFGQDLLLLAETTTGLDAPVYQQALRDSQLRVRERLTEVMAQHRLHMLVAPANAPAWKIDWVNGDQYAMSSSRPMAVSGYPSVVVPAGEIDGLPIGLSFMGLAHSEPALIQAAHVFEQLRGSRTGPALVPCVALEEALCARAGARGGPP